MTYAQMTYSQLETAKREAEAEFEAGSITIDDLEVKVMDITYYQEQIDGNLIAD